MLASMLGSSTVSVERNQTCVLIRLLIVIGSNRARNTPRNDRQLVFGNGGLLLTPTRDQDEGNTTIRLISSFPFDAWKLYHKEIGSSFKGYAPALDSNIDPANSGDCHEGFEVGWEELIPKENDEKRANDGAMAGANVWPSEPAGFREACLDY